MYLSEDNVTGASAEYRSDAEAVNYLCAVLSIYPSNL